LVGKRHAKRTWKNGSRYPWLDVPVGKALVVQLVKPFEHLAHHRADIRLGHRPCLLHVLLEVTEGAVLHGDIYAVVTVVPS
jgi:hypothetical protein